MAGLTCCLKFIIIALNFILLFGSLVLMVFGILFHVGTKLSFLEAMEMDTKNNIRDLITTTGIGDTDNIDKFSFTDLLNGWIAHTMIGIGLGFSILSFSGCCGAWYKVRILLLIYIILILMVIFLEVIIIPLVFTVPITIQGQIKRLLGFTLEKFTGLAGTNDETLAWMFTMDYFECCGIQSYTDFTSKSKQWDRTPGSITTQIDAPLICCVIPPTGGNDADTNCARDGTSKDVYSEGCFDLIWNKVLAESLYTYVIIGNVFILQILLLVASITFYRDAKKKNRVKPLGNNLIKTKK